MHRCDAQGLLALAGNATAQDWPTRPLTFVVPYAAGGSVDGNGRTMAQRMGEILGQQVVIENVGGAGGMTGSLRVARAPPDGYQMVIGNLGSHGVNQTLYKRPLYNSMTDFTPVGLVNQGLYVLLVRKDFPANTLPEFIAYAKANQAKLQYGSGGAGSTTHMVCILLNMALGIKTTHIPYRGTGPALQDLAGGRLDYECEPVPSALPLIQGATRQAHRAPGQQAHRRAPGHSDGGGAGAEELRGAELERAVPAKGHAGSDRSPPERGDEPGARHALGPRAAGEARPRSARAGAARAGVSREVPRKRDQEMGGADQGERRLGRVTAT